MNVNPSLLPSDHFRFWTVKRGWEEVAPIFALANREGRGFIAGSYAAHMAAPYHGLVIDPGDIDVFATSDQACMSLVDDLKARGYFVDSVTPIAFTMCNLDGLDVQVVMPHPSWTEFPKDIVDSFDLTVSRALLIDPETVIGDECLGSKDGKIIRVNSPMKTLSRIAKYSRRGVTFDDWELSKVLRAFDAMGVQSRKEMLDAVVNPSEMYDDYVYEQDYGDWYDEDDWWRGE